MSTRKIVQIAVAPETTNMRATTIALADDGTLWLAYDLSPFDKSTTWDRLPDLPQEDAS